VPGGVWDRDGRFFGGGGEMGTGGLEGGSFAGAGDGADGVGRFVMGRVICLVWFKKLRVSVVEEIYFMWEVFGVSYVCGSRQLIGFAAVR